MDHVEYPPLYPYLFPVREQRDDHRAVRRSLVLLYHQEIPILYPRPHHALPHDPQEITPPPRARREKLGRQRVGLLTGRHRLETTPGGDPAEQCHVARRLPAFPREPECPRTPPYPGYVSFLFQPDKVVVYGLRAT